MTKPESVVVYDGLPLSAGSSHGLGKIGTRDAYAAWRRFLDSCTVARTTAHFFTFPETPALAADRESRSRVSGAFPLDAATHRHPVPADRFGEALDLLGSLEPQPRNQWGMSPVWLWSTATYALLRPDGSEWPGQDPVAFDFQTPGGVHLGSSRTTLILEGRKSMSLQLNLPGATDDELAATIPWLQEHLPFRLSHKHWTRWTLAKNRTTYRGRKVNV